MRGLIGKAIRGAAQAGVPMLMEEYRAQNQAKRDALLQAFTKENMGAQQNFQSSERQAGQEFTAGQNELTRNQQQAQFDASRADNREQFQKGLALDVAKLDLLTRQAEQALEQGELGLVQAKRVEALRGQLIDPNASEEQISQAAQALSALLGDGQDSYQATTIYGDFDPMTQQQTRATGILNRRSGQITPVGMGGQGENIINWEDLK